MARLETTTLGSNTTGISVNSTVSPLLGSTETPVTPTVSPLSGPQTTEDEDMLTTTGPEDGEEGGNWVPFVEPVPDWDSAMDDWGVWWYIHIYGVGALFLISAVFPAISLIFLCRAKKMSQRPYFTALNILMLIFCLDRGIFMFLDAYNAKGSLHPCVAYLFISIGFPCLTSSFYLIFQAYIKVTRMQVTRTVHRERTIVIIIVAHFVISVSLDIAAGFTLHAIPLLMTCQAIFVVWGYTLCFLFAYVFRKLYLATVTTRRKIIRMSSNTAPAGVNQSPDPPKTSKSTAFKTPHIPAPKVIFGAKVILAAACLLFLLASLCLGGLLGCYLLDTIFGEVPEAWPWWGYELAVRLCELGLCWTILLAGGQPVARQARRRWSTRGSTSSRTGSTLITGRSSVSSHRKSQK